MRPHTLRLSPFLFFFVSFLQFFHGTAPKPSLDQIHQAIFGFNNDPAQSETVRCCYCLAVFTMFLNRVLAAVRERTHTARARS